MQGDVVVGDQQLAERRLPLNRLFNHGAKAGVLVQLRMQHQTMQGECQDVVLAAKPKLTGLLDMDIGLCRRLGRQRSRAAPASRGIRQRQVERATPTVQQGCNHGGVLLYRRRVRARNATTFGLAHQYAAGTAAGGQEPASNGPPGPLIVAKSASQQLQPNGLMDREKHLALLRGQ